MVAAALLNRFKSPLWAIAASILFVAVIVAGLLYFEAHEPLLTLLRWIDRQGAWADLLFVLIMALAVLLLLPGILFTAGAGFVFGLVKGAAYVVLGTTIGAALAFLMARYLLGRRARQFLAGHTRLRLLDAEMARHDWKVVMLIRLIPFFPGKLSNYIFGLTSASFRGYLVGSLIGFVPFSVHNVYLGSIAADLATLGQREIGRTPLEWVVYGLGFVATVGAVIYLSRLARRSLTRFAPDGDKGEVDP